MLFDQVLHCLPALLFASVFGKATSFKFTDDQVLEVFLVSEFLRIYKI